MPSELTETAASGGLGAVAGATGVGMGPGPPTGGSRLQAIVVQTAQTTLKTLTIRTALTASERTSAQQPADEDVLELDRRGARLIRL